MLFTESQSGSLSPADTLDDIYGAYAADTEPSAASAPARFWDGDGWKALGYGLSVVGPILQGVGYGGNLPLATHVGTGVMAFSGLGELANEITRYYSTGTVNVPKGFGGVSLAASAIVTATGNALVDAAGKRLFPPVVYAGWAGQCVGLVCKMVGEAKKWEHVRDPRRADDVEAHQNSVSEAARLPRSTASPARTSSYRVANDDGGLPAPARTAQPPANGARSPGNRPSR